MKLSDYTSGELYYVDSNGCGYTFGFSDGEGYGNGYTFAEGCGGYPRKEYPHPVVIF